MITLKVGPNAIVAKAVVAFSSLFNTTNCIIIFQCDGNYESWTPGNSLNAVTSTVAGKGYLAIMKQTLDVSADFFSLSDLGGEPTLNFVNNSATSYLHLATCDVTGDPNITFGGAPMGGFNKYDKSLLTDNDQLAANYIVIVDDSNYGELKDFVITVISTNSGEKTGTINTYSTTGDNGPGNHIDHAFILSALNEGDITIIVSEVLPG
jgi:hypothetical protein